MHKNTIDIITLGCSKNLVDSERLMHQLESLGYRVTHDAENPKGEIAVINTCGFIGDAKEESINTILEFCLAKEEGRISKLYVMGCLSERYLKELNKDLDKVAKSIDSTYTANVFVVSELFDVTVSPYIKEALENGGSITITFDTNYTSKPVVLHRMKSGGWEIIDDSKVSLKDGKLVVEFTSLSPIAFLSVSAEKIEEGNKKKNITIAVVFVVLIVLIAAVIVIILLLQDRKKKEPNNIEKIEKSDE